MQGLHLRSIEEEENRKVSKMLTFLLALLLEKSAEFVEKYVHQGTKIVLTGRIQTGSYTNKDNIKVYTTEVIAEDIEFAESKAAAEGSSGAGGHQKPDQTENDGFMNIPEGIDEELPFN